MWSFWFWNNFDGIILIVQCCNSFTSFCVFVCIIIPIAIPFLFFQIEYQKLSYNSIFFNFAKYFLPVHILFCYILAVFTKICDSNFIMWSYLWWTILIFGYSCNTHWKLKIQVVVTYPVYIRLLLFIDLGSFIITLSCKHQHRWQTMTAIIHVHRGWLRCQVCVVWRHTSNYLCEFPCKWK